MTFMECSCSAGHMNCPKGAEGPEPPKVQVCRLQLHLDIGNLIFFLYPIPTNIVFT